MWNVVAHLKFEFPRRPLQEGDVAARDTPSRSDRGQEGSLVIVDGVEKRVDDSLNQTVEKAEDEEKSRDSGESDTRVL